MSSARHWVRTWMVTSSGIRSSSMSWRMKSKSGWLALGKPTSISLNPMCTRVSNMRRLRAGSMGSISAWLPSRRSTEHHSGALVMRWLGHRRSSSASGTGRKGSYFSNGIFFGVTGSGGIAPSLSCGVGNCRRKTEKPPGRFGAGGGASTYVGCSPQVRRRPATGWRIAPWCRSPTGGVKTVSLVVVRRVVRLGLLVAVIGIVQQVVRRLLASPPPTPDPSGSTAARAPDKVTAAPRSAAPEDARVAEAEAEPVIVPAGEGPAQEAAPQAPAATKAPAKKATAAKKAPAKKAAAAEKAPAKKATAAKKAPAKKAAKPAEPGTGSESD